VLKCGIMKLHEQGQPKHRAVQVGWRRTKTRYSGTCALGGGCQWNLGLCRLAMGRGCGAVLENGL